MEQAFIVGVGMTRFEKHGSRARDYPQMMTAALGKRLVYDLADGERALYPMGPTAIAVYDVNSNCATGRGWSSSTISVSVERALSPRTGRRD